MRSSTQTEVNELKPLSWIFPAFELLRRFFGVYEFNIALPELVVHTKGALNCGATREEILEVVIQMIAYCGFPAATNALKTIQETFDEMDAAENS